MTGTRPSLAVWKLASCDGCQLTLLDCEDELLAVAGGVEIAHVAEASSAEVEGPCDVSLVEGSVTTERDARRIAEIRAASKFLVTIGACATAGGIQALRSFADVAEFTSVVYARPSSRPWPPRPRYRTTSRWTSSCAAARSTGVSCSSC